MIIRPTAVGTDIAKQGHVTYRPTGCFRFHKKRTVLRFDFQHWQHFASSRCRRPGEGQQWSDSASPCLPRSRLFCCGGQSYVCVYIPIKRYVTLHSTNVSTSTVVEKLCYPMMTRDNVGFLLIFTLSEARSLDLYLPLGCCSTLHENS